MNTTISARGKEAYLAIVQLSLTSSRREATHKAFHRAAASCTQFNGIHDFAVLTSSLRRIVLPDPLPKERVWLVRLNKGATFRNTTPISLL
jgi:hypothetical protein